MIKNRNSVIIAARKLRIKGLSHRQISHILGISLGLVAIFTKDIEITREQHNKLKRNTGIFIYPKSSRSLWASKGSNNWLSRLKYSREILIAKIKKFEKDYQRIPTKREFYKNWQAYRRIFGSWNKAIEEAGFLSNPERFTHDFIANDGHKCNSLAEKIIDDWLKARGIEHKCHVYYPGQKKFKTDFLINNKYWIEFLGLKDQLTSYDEVYKRKQGLAKKLGIDIIEVNATDLFPHNKLEERLGFLLQ